MSYQRGSVICFALEGVVDDPASDIPDLAREICRMLIEQIAHLTDSMR